MTIALVVDDDLGTRDSLARMLHCQGCDVLTATPGAQVLRAMQEHKPDLVFLDLNCLIVTALAAIRGLRPPQTESPHIIITGFGTIESAAAATRLRGLDYLTKPVDEGNLGLVIGRLLRGNASDPSAAVRADGMERWALAIASVIDAPRDPKNLVDWSRIRGVAPATLRAWCRTAALRPKASLDLARVLRAVLLARSKGWSPTRLLDVADHRTLDRLMVAGGLSITKTRLPTARELLMRQSFIADDVAIEELQRVLFESGWSC